MTHPAIHHQDLKGAFAPKANPELTDEVITGKVAAIFLIVTHRHMQYAQPGMSTMEAMKNVRSKATIEIHEQGKQTEIGKAFKAIRKKGTKLRAA